MHARLKDTEKDIKHLFNLHKDGWDAQCTLAKLAATTARDVNEVKSNHKLVCFLSGELKKTIVTKFDAFKKAASEARAKAKEDAAKSGAAATAASASHPTGALAAAAGVAPDVVDALAAQASNMQVDASVKQNWPQIFMKEAYAFLKEQLDDADSQHHSLKAELGKALNTAVQAPVHRSVKSVVMEPAKPPESKPWCAVITLWGGAAGAIQELRCHIESCI